MKPKAASTLFVLFFLLSSFVSAQEPLENSIEDFYQIPNYDYNHFNLQVKKQKPKEIYQQFALISSGKFIEQKEERFVFDAEKNIF